MFDPENVGQGHGIQYSKRSRSMANINTCIKVILEHFSLVLNVIEIFTFHNSWSWKYRLRSVTMYNVRSSGRRWQMSDFLSDGRSNVCNFPAFPLKIAASKVWPWKFISSSRSRIIAMTLFYGKCQIYKRNFWFFFTKVRPLWTKITATQTDTHTGTCTHKRTSP